MKRLGTIIFILVLGAIRARAELSSPGPERLNAQVDFNHDGELDYDEIIFAVIRKQTGSGDILGFQAKGHAPKADAVEKLDTPVRDAWLDIIDVAVPISAAGPKRFKLNAINPKKLGLQKLVVAAPTDAVVSHERYLHDFNYQIRRSKDDLDSDVNDPYAQGALFSYARDYNRGDDQWAARGILALEYSITENPDYLGPDNESKTIVPASALLDPKRRGDQFYLRSAIYRLNVGFDKVTTGGGDRDELNSLDFFGTATYSWHLPDHNFTKIVGLTAELGVHDATDFDFEKQVYAVTLDLKPRTLLPGDGVYKKVGLYHDQFNDESCFLKFRWSATVHAEIGTVEEANAEPNLLRYDQFARIGGKAGVSFLFFPELLDNRLSANVSYAHYEALQSNVPQTHLFSASLQYVFSVGSGLHVKADKKEGEVRTMIARDTIWTLRVEYTNGTAPLVDEDDNHLLVGLGIAF